MKTDNIFFLLIFCCIFISSCDEEDERVALVSPPRDIIIDQFPEAQAELKVVLDGIFSNIQNKEADELISNHIYGPKFTEFRDSEPRTGSAENEAYERGFVDAISDFEYELKDLKIDVFGEVAIATFHADFRPTLEGNQVQIWGSVTLVFVKTQDTWKITHEHFSPLNM